ncbi:UNVERIFIED_ORG: peptidoglycan hydrolase CwlO-like protein [Bacillus sp. B2I3]|nr:peptidoglycan hydrolase CwlO-like protein [Bacillus sp. B2I3]
MSIHEDNLKRWKEIDEFVSRTNIMLYGFDISKLPFKEQQLVEEQRKRRAELEEMKERLNPKPKPILSAKEEIERRREEIKWAKFEKVANGKPLKELTNDHLEKQLKIMRSIVER